MTLKGPTLALESVQGVVFDLDGTLVDSLEGITASVNWILAQVGKPPLHKKKVATFIGEGARSLFRKVFAGDPKGLEDRLYNQFIGHYHDNSPSVTPFYPHARELLCWLGQRLPLAVFTNKPVNETRVLWKALEADDLFSMVICPEHVGRRKPHPDGLLAIARQFDMPPSNLLMVGDARPDAQTAWMAGTQFLPVAYGYGGPGFYEPLPHLPPLAKLAAWPGFKS